MCVTMWPCGPLLFPLIHNGKHFPIRTQKFVFSSHEVLLTVVRSVHSFLSTPNCYLRCQFTEFIHYGLVSTRLLKALNSAAIWNFLCANESLYTTQTFAIECDSSCRFSVVKLGWMPAPANLAIMPFFFFLQGYERKLIAL